MCYSGMCRWEDYMGDCGFPNDDEVREKYPLPVCDIPIHETEKEYLDEVQKDIKIILKKKKMKNIINDIVKPENDIEIAIACDEHFIEGCSMGKPRRGHPEGKIIYHIKEVLKNIDILYSGNDEDRTKLRQIALVHDTFKHLVDRSKPKVGDNHHGSFAKKFAMCFINDEIVLKIIKQHDEAYNAWGMGNRRGDWYEAERRATRLIQGFQIDGGLDLYLKFYHCDNATGNKSNDDYEWFKNLTLKM